MFRNEKPFFHVAELASVECDKLTDVHHAGCKIDHLLLGLMPFVGNFHSLAVNPVRVDGNYVPGNLSKKLLHIFIINGVTYELLNLNLFSFLLQKACSFLLCEAIPYHRNKSTIR